ncbi:MAG: hypothetical protein M3323_03775 [Actinomycetota bacterium]|nr:hypothetical protein [Actinomycetota bacterium]
MIADAASPPAVVLNGIDGATGDYAIGPLDPAAVAALARGETLPPGVLDELEAKHAQATVDHLGVMAGVDAYDLAQAGWGVVFASDTAPAVRDALSPLLEHRKAAATRRDGRFYRELAGADGYRTGESSLDFLVRHGVAPGQPANPERMPYYLLIVGSPEAVPFRFQYQLDVIYATGRVWFDDVDSYARYAAAVVAAEGGPAPRDRRAVLFGAENAGDAATHLSANHLVRPLHERLAAGDGWTIEAVAGEGATKARLGDLIGGSDRTGLLFTATHGMTFPNGDRRQVPHAGALLCQDWPGRAWKQAIPEDFYFSGDDVAPDTTAAGLIAFLFACYGAGTPATDEFNRDPRVPRNVAPHAFVGRLPQRLLDAGALAVAGHVDRAWSYSFAWPGLDRQVEVFESALGELLRGAPVGLAMEFFNTRYATLTSELESLKEEAAYGAVPDDARVAHLWTAKTDARNYVVIGDPAARLPGAAAPS